ncbi:MAG: hypothetical protein ISF22_10800 [Methanomassiliicoccus sp.]|nr:hypothetical protein [Methanomassiliicoccus sp.]
MDRKITIPGELSLAAGLLLISLAIPLMVRADFGISTISSLPFVLSNVFDGMSFGVWNLIFQTCLLIILVAITGRFKTGYLISFVLTVAFGSILDIFSGILSGLPTDLGLRLLYFAASYLMMCLAIAMMVSSRVPLIIIDAFINDLTAHYHVTFRRLKTLFDVICLSLSVAISIVVFGDLVGVGIGTILLAFITGSGVHAANRLMSRAIVIKPWSETLGNMAK